MKKQRRSLDSLAEQFVYGESAEKPLDSGLLQSSETNLPAVEPLSSQVKERNSLVSKLMATTEKEATIRLTVDLPESMHKRLSILAAQTGKKKVEIVRMLLEDALEGIE